MNGWLTGYLARIGFAAVLGVVGLRLASHYCDRVGIKLFWTYYIIRILSMYVLCVVAGQVPADVVGWYMHAKWMAIDGVFPGKGFLTPYYLGMNFLFWLSVRCWDSPFSIIAMFTFVEVVCVTLSFRMFRLYVGERDARRVSILYLTSPIVTMCSWFGAQDEPVILLAVVCVFCLLQTSRQTWLFLFASFAGICFTKILTAFFLQPLYFSRKYKTVLLCFGGFLLYIVLSFLVGIDPFNLVFGRRLGLFAEGDDLILQKTIGNFWFIFSSVPNIIQTLIFFLVIGLLTALPFYRLFFSGDKSAETAIDISVAILVVWGLTFMVLYRMSFATYLIPILPFVWCITLKGRLNGVFVLAWSWIVAIKDHLYFARFRLPFDSGIASWALISITIICVVCTCLLLIFAMRYLLKIAYGKVSDQ